MKKLVLTDFVWKLLEQLGEPETELRMCNDDYCYRFHLRQRGVEGRIVMNSSIDALVRSGMVTRAPCYGPTYVISRRGFQELRRRRIVQYLEMSA